MRCLRTRLAPQRLGDAEVEHFDEVALAEDVTQQQVLGLQVAVHDAGVVCLGQALQQLDRDVTRAHGAQPLLTLDDFVEPVAADVLHHVEGQALVGLVEVEDANRIGVAQPLGQQHLALEARRELGVAQNVGKQHFDGDVFVDAGVGRAKDHREAAAAQLLTEDVATPELLPRLGEEVFHHVRHSASL